MNQNISEEGKNWAAGFLDGEGCFHFTGGSITVSATQVDPWPLEKLKSILGGPSLYRTQRKEVVGKTYFVWSVHGDGAEYVMRTLRDYLSPRRQTKIDTLLAWRATRPGSGVRGRHRKDVCRNGHAMIGENVYLFPTPKGFVKRGCKTCSQASRIKYQQSSKQKIESSKGE